VGLDTGGTFTDIVAYDLGDGEVRTEKVPSDAPPVDMVAALGPLGIDAAAAVVHGTTRITNAILQGRLSPVALVTTEGFTDVLAIGRQAREDLYDLRRPARSRPIVPAELCFGVRERVAPDGRVIEALADAEIVRLQTALEAAGIEAVAVCLLHAYANPEHERRIAAALRERWPVSVSHEVSAERREYERTSTTALNASVLRFSAEYLSDLEGAVGERLGDAPLYVVLSAGGMASVDTARRLPLSTVMSGPAAGAIAAARLAERLGVDRAVSFDMGGTSTDVSLILSGRVRSERDRQLGGHAVRLPAVAVDSIATGGGSIVGVDDVGALRVGPRWAGAFPGPACFGRGGQEATVTDADVVAGLIQPGTPVGGVEIDPERARAALAPVAAGLGLDLEATAHAILDVAGAQMERALRLATVQRGYDLRGCTLIAYGGAGTVHAGPLAARAGIPRVIVPRLASVFSALGCCLSEVTVDVVQTQLAVLDAETIEACAALLDSIQAARLGELAGELQDGRRVVIERQAELRYRGQNDALAVAWLADGDPRALREAFMAAHRREYGYATDEPVEVTALRCRITLAERLGWPAMPADSVTSTAGGVAQEVRLRVMRDRWAQAVAVNIGELGEGREVAGPALIAAPMTSVTVWPGQVARLDGDGNLVLDARP